ncbi:MAG TPA: DUF6241 domain-containing protein [Clostridiaceae bacterium]|nr:DUF6241 domain-containing protein [Clostridiaceae bacterium]
MGKFIKYLKWVLIGLLVAAIIYTVFDLTRFNSIGTEVVTNRSFEKMTVKEGKTYKLTEAYDNSQDAIHDTIILETIHKMANEVVIADKKWGRIEMSEENINTVTVQVLASYMVEEKKTELLRILGLWKKGDFRSAHHDHNYVWELLGGTVGKATGVDTTFKADWVK